jgi:hypothetical protein
MEGLQALVWWHEKIRRGLVGSKSKCETCMQSMTTEARQLEGCGYEPPPEEKLRPFVNPSVGLGYKGPNLTVCPGYSTSLPEVIEAARARMHWEKGGPHAIGVTDWRDDPLAEAVEILESEISGDFRQWFALPASKGGGGPG